MVGLHFSVLFIMYYLCTIKQYDSIKIIPDLDFNEENDATDLKKAMDKCPTQKGTIINIICKRGIEQRLKIADKFFSLYRKDLRKKLRSAFQLYGNSKTVMSALMTPLPDFYAQELHHAMFWADIGEDVLVEILGTLSNNDVKEVADSYTRMYKETLKDAIEKTTTGYFKSLCVSLLVGNRDELSDVNEDDVISEANTLNSAKKFNWPTKLWELYGILVNKSYVYSRRLFAEFKKLTSESIEILITQKTFGNFHMALLSIVRIIENKELYFASRLKSALAGLETDHRTLIRILVTRSEVDIEGIKEAFSMTYNIILESHIKKYTWTYNQRILLKIIA